MAKESAENVQKLKSCGDSGDAVCVADICSKMELSDQAYTELRKQDERQQHAHAVGAGTINVRDGANQQQDVGTLSRDTEHAANGLSPIFDKEKEPRRLQEAQLIGEIGTQVGDIARTERNIAPHEEAKKRMESHAGRQSANQSRGARRQQCWCKYDLKGGRH